MRVYVNLNLRRVGSLYGAILACTVVGCWEEIRYTPSASDSTAIRRDEPRQVADRPARGRAADLPATPSAGPSLSAESSDEAAVDFANDVAAKLAAQKPAEPASPMFPGAAVAAAHESPVMAPPVATTPAGTASVPVAAEPTTSPTSITTPPPSATDPAHSPRRIAWLLGNKLSLSALENDRGGATDEAAKLFSQAQTLAEMLDTTVGELPPARDSVPPNANFDRALQYLFAQGQPIGRTLAAKFGDDHAALFELAMKSNILLALYRPHASVAGALSSAIEQAGGRSGLPVKLWQPLMDAMANNAPADDVRKAVYQMHSDVDRYLVSPAAVGSGTAAQSP
jgi:hypothetical protein